MAKKHYLKLSKILQKLLYEKRINASELAREVDLPVPTVHRLVTGKSTRPYESSLKPIADYFSIEVTQLLGEKPLPSDEKASTLKSNSNDLEKNLAVSLPLIPWNNLTNLEKMEEYSEIPFLGKISDKGFATIMPDTSMEPLVQRDSIIIFDPLILPTDRSCILIKLHETKAYVLRQLLIDADHKYLKSLNSDLSTFNMRLLHKNDESVACLVESRFNFQADRRSEIATELKT